MVAMFAGHAVIAFGFLLAVPSRGRTSAAAVGRARGVLGWTPRLHAHRAGVRPARSVDSQGGRCRRRRVRRRALLAGRPGPHVPPAAGPARAHEQERRAGRLRADRRPHDRPPRQPRLELVAMRNAGEIDAPAYVTYDRRIGDDLDREEQRLAELAGPTPTAGSSRPLTARVRLRAAQRFALSEAARAGRISRTRSPGTSRRKSIESSRPPCRRQLGRHRTRRPRPEVARPTRLRSRRPSRRAVRRIAARAASSASGMSRDTTVPAIHSLIPGCSDASDAESGRSGMRP